MHSFSDQRFSGQSSPEPGQTPPVLSVSQLTRRVRTLLESHFDFLWVGGEIGNFTAPSSGHWYFTLKDGTSQVRCAMFRNRNQRLRFRPEPGDEVRLRCRVSLYQSRGDFQLIVEYMEAAGAGALQAAFEKLKTRLHGEGLFAAERKQALPAEVARIGVVTSPTGAAVHDILTVLRRRCPGIEVCLFPVAVQGDGAAAQIAAAIERANRWQQQGKLALDALIVGRGGGSLEDLWAFNEEVVARAIAASVLPVVSAVGHEVDFSIADLVADQRAPTPSAAAELLSPDQREWQEQLVARRQQLALQIERRLAQASLQLQHLRQRLKHPGAQLREHSQRVDDLEQRLLLAQQNLRYRYHQQLHLARSRLYAASPRTAIARYQQECSARNQRLERGMQRRLQYAGEHLQHLAQLLDSLSPLGTLQRGYAIITDKRGAVITDPSAVAEGDAVEARLAGGRLGLTVTRRNGA